MYCFASIWLQGLLFSQWSWFQSNRDWLSYNKNAEEKTDDELKKKNLVHVYCCNCVCHCGVHIVSQLKVKETGESAASNHMKAFFNILYPWCTSCCGNCKIEAELGITSILYSVVLVPPETTAHVLAESYMVWLKKQHQPTEVHIKTETTQRKGTKGMMKTWSSLLHGYMCTYILGQESIT